MFLHEKAAGLTIEETLDNAIKKLINSYEIDAIAKIYLGTYTFFKIFALDLIDFIAPFVPAIKKS